MQIAVILSIAQNKNRPSTTQNTTTYILTYLSWLENYLPILDSESRNLIAQL